MSNVFGLDPSPLEAVTGVLDWVLHERDEYTHAHSTRVVEMTAALARACGLDATLVRALRACALFHDVGKIGIPDAILLKPGRLTPAEFDVMKRHAAMGAGIVARVRAPAIETCMAIIRHHHEDFDGGGYPDGIAGGHIPLGARVLAVADRFDAMTSTRVYRQPLSDADALQILHDGRDHTIDPEIAEVFIGLAQTPGERWKVA